MEAQHVSIHGHDVSFRGGGSGPVVVLIHGMAGSSVTWEPVLAELTRHYTVIAPTCPATVSRTSLGVTTRSVRMRAAFAIFCWRSDTSGATIVGSPSAAASRCSSRTSTPNGASAWCSSRAADWGRRSRCCCALTLPGAEHLMPIACNGRVRDAGTAVTGFLDRIGLRPVPAVAEMWRSYASLSDASTREAFQHTLRSVVDMHGQRVSATDRMYLAADVPTLIVWGDRDPIIPVDHGIKAHEMIPGSRFEVFEGAGHFPHCEQPERFVEVLVDFMDSTAPMTKSELTHRI